MALSHSLGFPRFGRDRELKKALEAYWRGELDQAGLQTVGRQLRAALGSRFPIIGVGGIMGPEDAVSKIRAGADVVQIYTGLIYEGPAIVARTARALKNLA